MSAYGVAGAVKSVSPTAPHFAPIAIRKTLLPGTVRACYNGNIMGIQKCPHGVYWPAADPIAFSCQQCNPEGTGTGATPVLPRSSSDPLFAIKTKDAETCETCGCLRTYFSPNCRACGTAFPITDLRGREQGTANLHNPGVCPGCNSTVHYEITPKKWQCADCDTIYKAPKQQ
jgi:hypothetical protein